jgi:hypothetical protein
VDKLSDINAGQTVTVQEGKGIVASKAYSAAPVRKPVATKVAKLGPAVVSPHPHQ